MLRPFSRSSLSRESIKNPSVILKVSETQPLSPRVADRMFHIDSNRTSPLVSFCFILASVVKHTVSNQQKSHVIQFLARLLLYIELKKPEVRANAQSLTNHAKGG